ncbi:hypothetical protein ACIA3Z_03005 [Lactobacillus delbrueckii subsp. bulgaricus]
MMEYIFVKKPLSAESLTMWRCSCSGETLNIISFALSKKLKKLWTEFIPRLPFYSGNQRDIHGLDITITQPLKKASRTVFPLKKLKKKSRKSGLQEKYRSQ